MAYQETDDRWQSKAECRSADAMLFFSPDEERGAAKAARARVAKQICNMCPVLKQCRDDAISRAEPYGVWGGMSEDERKPFIDRIKHQRQAAVRSAAAIARNRPEEIAS